MTSWLRGARIAGIAIGCTTAVACASGRGLIEDQNLVLLEIGATHQSQVLEWIGPPDDRRGDSQHGATWTYQREARIYRDPVSLFVRSFMLFPPAREVRDDRERERLDLSFDANGILQQKAHDRGPRAAPPGVSARWGPPW